MKIAIPTAGGQLCMHFGHCEQFSILDIDGESKAIQSQSMEQPPPHEPGLLPAWLAEKGVEVVLAGGMGQRAQQIFAAHGVMVVTGIGAGTPEQIAQSYLDNTLEAGENVCDH
jgi:ATP-binding protein involved in chromosome partitioning